MCLISDFLRAGAAKAGRAPAPTAPETRELRSANPGPEGAMNFFRHRPRLKEFFFPKLSRKLFARIAVVAGLAYAFFGYVCLPTVIHGRSMEPNWRDGEFTFCCRLIPRLRSVQIGDVVAVRLAGARFMYLKRVVALAGDTVEFRHGTLFRNGEPQAEPYLRFRGDWTLPPRKVPAGMVYLVGDNRAMPMDQHVFGAAEMNRIFGKPLW